MSISDLSDTSSCSNPNDPFTLEPLPREVSEIVSVNFGGEQTCYTKEALCEMAAYALKVGNCSRSAKEP